MKRKKKIGKTAAISNEKGVHDPPVALPGDLQRIAEVAGTEAALKIAREFRGTTLYIPDVFRQLRDEAIRRHYDGGVSVKRLAIEHRLTERWVWRILKGDFLKNPH